ncbi:MAG TPA: hypothetical protein EYP53_02570 [Candidatus Latescibacteria bacterium]|nr:hypothetical protein [Candidatus Latescibacterota bacterium]
MVDEAVEAGSHRVLWDGGGSSGNQVASGIYLYHLTVNGGQWVAVRRIALLR